MKKLLLTICILIIWTPTLAGDFVFVTTTDFSTGSASVLDLENGCAADINVASIHSDAEARYFGGLIYVANREAEDNIEVLDPAASFATLQEFSVGASSNPHDIHVLTPTRAYVTRYDETDLWIIDPSAPAHTGTISLAALADADGIPEMDRMVRVGDYLFVSIQRLDRNQPFFPPTGTSYLAVIDVTTDMLVDTDGGTIGTQPITLTGADPYSEIQLDPYTGKLYVSCVGFFGLLDGGVEVVNPATFQSEGYMLTEAEAGGDITDVEIVAPDLGYAIISDASFHNVLIAFNPQTGLKTATVYAPGAFVLNDCEPSPDGVLFVTDRTPVLPGIRKYDLATGAEITTNPIDVGLPPFDITLSYETPTGIAGELPAGGRASLGPNYPNPFNPATTIPFTLERAGGVRLVIYDAAGRRVRTLVADSRAAGAYDVTWDARDDAGRVVATGVYFARLEAAGSTATRKLMLMK